MEAQKVHNLKTWPNFFQDILERRKSFELRYNDRDFNVGDVLILNEYDPKKNKYLGRVIERKIIYKIEDIPGLEKGYCILGIESCH